MWTEQCKLGKEFQNGGSGRQTPIAEVEFHSKFNRQSGKVSQQGV